MIQILITILFSSVKFAMTFPVAIMHFEFNFLETILWTNVVWSVIYTGFYLICDDILFTRI